MRWTGHIERMDDERSLIRAGEQMTTKTGKTGAHVGRQPEHGSEEGLPASWTATNG